MSDNLKRGYLYFYIFMLIYIEFGYHMVVENQLSGNMRMLILIALFVPLVLFGQKKVYIDTMLVFVFLILTVLFNLFLRMDDYGNYLMLLIPMVIGFCTVISVDKKEYVKVFSNIVLFLSAYSLVIFSINLVSQPMINSLPFLGYRYGAQIHDAFFSVAITNSQYIRNYGIAWEPGAFALLIGLAMYFELLYTPKIRMKRLIILTLTMLTTFSTLGYIFTILLFAALLFNSVFFEASETKMGKRRNTIIVIILFSVIVFLFLPQEVKDLVFSKLDGLFSEKDYNDMNYTTEARIDAIIYPFQAFLKSPLTGVGYDEFSYINMTQCNSVATNTIINWFALFGLPFGLPCTYYYLKNLYIDRRSFKLRLLPFIILVIAFCFLISTESLLRISLVYILIFYGVQAGRKENLESPAMQEIP